MRDFSKVSPKLWQSRRFRGLPTDDARVLHLYLLTSQHMTSAGCCRIPDPYVLVDLLWADDKLAVARPALIEAELIAFDAATDEYFVRRWFVHNPPTNPKHLQGAKRIISEIDSDLVREAAEAELSEFDPKPQALQEVNSGYSRLTQSRFIGGRG